MKALILIASVFCSMGVSAQFTTNVFWTTQTEMDAKQVIFYTTDAPLVWSDFKGAPGAPSPVAAITSSGFGYKANMKSLRGKGELNVAVYCYFDKTKSWVRPGRTTSYILTHEQHHFDVSYLAAVLFVNKVRAANLTAANANDQLPKIYRECTDYMNKLQDEYDGQTSNGRLEDKQEKWNRFFGEKLLVAIR